MKNWRSCCCLVLLIVAVLVTVGTVLFLVWKPRCGGENFYTHAAVAADSVNCSEIGRNILEQGGSAVDGAIAALLCSSLINPQSMGIGGGAIFTIYSASKGRVTVINAREVIPQNLKPSSFPKCVSYLESGPSTQWIGVPGELRGYWEVHKKFGKLPWKSLFEPSIQLAKSGFQLPVALKGFLLHPKLRPKIINSSLGSLFYTSAGHPHEIVQYPQLAETLRVIADQGVDAFYNGNITNILIEDVQKDKHYSGSTFTLEDFKQYKASVMEPLNISLGDYVMYSPPQPTWGAILSLILNILKGFNFTPKSMERRQRAQTYHRIIEALKFTNGQLSRLKDPKVHSKVMSELLSDQFAELIRRQIDDQVHPPHYYNTVQEIEKYGTSHVSVIDKDGNAVSVTSSINHIFGSMIISPRTGIILNNQLADFCQSVGSRPDIKAGQQPPSYMSPSILISQDKKSIMLVGGAGGKMIISAIAQIIMNKLWFGLSMEDAIEKRRVHVTSSNSVQFEKDFDEAVKKTLQQKGHNTTDPSPLPSVVQGIFKDHDCIEAVSDYRKYGKSAGY
ncbi:glutathione hydrolase 5 proenzyme-like [Heterodontus francisci]|uniref:glutathione hydrolase 5 proenzyme-like n=1 Tax=Heterodontus francisci TaxID=7792 RepID=UPI00355B6AF2